MSWGVSAFGRAAAVRTSIVSQFENGGKCSEPEESVRQAAKVLIDASLASQDPTSVVSVTANGHQSYKDWNAKTGLTNNLSISIAPQAGFLE